MKFRFLNRFLIVFMAINLIACQSGGDQVSEEEQTSEIQENAETTPSFNQDKPNVISCNGKVDVPPQFRADVHAKMDGFIDNISVLVGQRVKKGDVLATISSQEFILLQNQFLQTQADLFRLEKDFKRKETLNQTNAVSEKEFERTKSELAQAKAAYSSLIEQIKFVGLSLNQLESGNVVNQVSIFSPIDGFVNRAEVNNGKHVSANELLFQIVDESHKHVELSVFSSDAQKLKQGQLVIIKANGSDTEFKGTVFLINQALDNDLQSVNVHVHPLNDSLNLMVSSYVDATIYVDSIMDVKPEKH